MPITIKKRYPRSTRFRKVMSNNLQTVQTRRLEIIPAVTVALQVVTCTFDRPVTILSNAVAITGIVDQVPLAPTLIEYGASTNIVELTFPGAAPTSIVFPFEDPAIRDQIGAYVRSGSYP